MEIRVCHRPKHLFLNLIHHLSPALVLDIGSMDGADSRRFREMNADAAIIAFEANPHNFARMLSDERLLRADIEIRELCISSEPIVSFYVSRESLEGKGNRGMSSTLKSLSAESQADEIKLAAHRLDQIIPSSASDQSVALWIDVEGAAFDVLMSATGAAKKIAFVHVEVELIESWMGQRLKSDVMDLTAEFDLLPLAQSRGSHQQDIVLINRCLYEANKGRIDGAMRLTNWFGPSYTRLLSYF